MPLLDASDRVQDLDARKKNSHAECIINLGPDDLALVHEASLHLLGALPLFEAPDFFSVACELGSMDAGTRASGISWAATFSMSRMVLPKSRLLQLAQSQLFASKLASKPVHTRSSVLLLLRT